MSINKKFIDIVSAHHIDNDDSKGKGESINNSLIKLLQDHFSKTEKEEISSEKIKSLLIAEGYTPKVKMMNAIAIPIVFLLSIPILYISAIAFIIRGIILFGKKTTHYIKKTSNKNSKLIDNTKLVGKSVSQSIVMLPSNSKEIDKYKMRGMLYILLGFILIFLQTYIAVSFMK